MVDKDKNKIHKSKKQTDFISIKTKSRIANIPSDYALLCVDELRRGLKCINSTNTIRIDKAVEFVRKRLKESKVYFIADRRMLIPNERSKYCYVDIDVTGRFNAIDSTMVNVDKGKIKWSFRILGEKIETVQIDINKFALDIIGVKKNGRKQND